MKRRFLTLTLALLTSLLLVLPASAAEYGAIYTESDYLQSDELTELGKRYLPRYAAFYDTDLRVDVLTGIGNFSSLADAAAAIYDEYEYGYGQGRNGVTLTMLVHEDEDGVVLNEWYLYAAGDNDALTSTGIQGAVAALSESIDADDWAGDAEQDTQALMDAIATVTDYLGDFFYASSATDTIGAPDMDSTTPESTDAPDSWPAAGEQIGYVTDTAGIMTMAERQELEQAAQAVSEKYGFGVYMMTVESFTEATDSYTVDDAAVTLYKKYDLGLTDEDKGVLLLLSMKGRDFSLITYSDYGNFVFDEVAREEMAYYFLDDFSRNDWYSGFADYVASCDNVLANGPDKLQSEITAMTGMIFLFPLIIAAIAVFILGLKMKSVARATEAAAYAGGGLNLTNSHDLFTHSTETRRKRKSESSGGGGGGGKVRSSSSGGFGRTSGKF